MNTVDIRTHKNHRIMVNWQGPGTYYLEKSLNIWVKVTNTDVYNFAVARDLPMVDIEHESELRR
jgi:hypothetical protein